MQDPFSPQGIPNNRLVQLIETQRAQLKCVSVDWPKSHCLLADIGEYLARSAMILSQLAAELADGQHITSYAKETVRKMKEKTDFSDLDDLDYFDSKHTSLRNLACQLRSSATDIKSQWASSTPVPQASEYVQRDTEPSVHFPTSPFNTSAVHDQEELSSGQPVIQHGAAVTLPSRPNEQHLAESPSTDDLAHNTIQELLSSLSSRGKGNYTCPYAHRCDKGGVDGHAKPVVFERNSAFRSHLEKHGKIFKCDLSGCKNTAGFARKDQLRRHQETVPHES